MHLDREALYDFLLGKLSAQRNREVVRHLLTGCEACRRISREVWQGETAPPEIDLSALAGEVWRQGRASDKEWEAAPDLLAELLALTPERQTLVARNSARFRTRAVCELLCEEACSACSSDAEMAVQLANVAALIASGLSRERYGRGVANDVEAHAWATLGHAQREAARHFEAEEAFRQAKELLREGSGDARVSGRVSHLEAILRHAQRRFDEALRLFHRATREFAAAGDEQRLGGARIDLARTLREIGDLEGAVRSVRSGLALIDARRHPRKVLAGKHNLTLYLQELGESDEAMQLIAELLPLHARFGGEVDRLRLRWLEGKIAHLQGDLERAGGAFEEVREAFIERSMPYDAALVSLDLAAVHLQRERFSEVLRLTGEMVTIFRALRIDRETIAALYLLERAAAARQVSLGLLAELAAFLKRARSEPGLVFEPRGD